MDPLLRHLADTIDVPRTERRLQDAIDELEIAESLLARPDERLKRLR